jgi:hypothetical protein
MSNVTADPPAGTYSPCSVPVQASPATSCSTATSKLPTSSTARRVAMRAVSDESRTASVKANAPFDVGVPVTRPVMSSLRPGGSCPEPGSIDQP